MKENLKEFEANIIGNLVSALDKLLVTASIYSFLGNQTNGQLIDVECGEIGQYVSSDSIMSVSGHSSEWLLFL